MKNLLIVLVLFCACNSNSEGECKNGELVTLKDFTGLDGCTWMLAKEDNSSLEPINLSEYVSNPVDGDAYIIEYKIRTDLASICLVGSIVELTCCEKK